MRRRDSAWLPVLPLSVRTALFVTTTAGCSALLGPLGGDYLADGGTDASTIDDAWAGDAADAAPHVGDGPVEATSNGGDGPIEAASDGGDASIEAASDGGGNGDARADVGTTEDAHADVGTTEDAHAPDAGVCGAASNGKRCDSYGDICCNGECCIGGDTTCSATGACKCGSGSLCAWGTQCTTANDGTEYCCSGLTCSSTSECQGEGYNACVEVGFLSYSCCNTP
jgi:hypothetical protein